MFDGTPVTDLQVGIRDSVPSQLSLSSAGTVSADADAAPLAITVGLQDAAGRAVAMARDVAVTLTSTSAGTFSMTAGEIGTGSFIVTIEDGETSTVVYYMDSMPGIATVMATAPGFTMASQRITVTTNTAVNGSETVPVPATDPVGSDDTDTAMGMPSNKLSYTSTIPMGTSLFHVPLDVEGLDTVGDLKVLLGDAAQPPDCLR